MGINRNTGIIDILMFFSHQKFQGTRYLLILFALLAAPFIPGLQAQQEAPVVKSEIIENIDGKDFYLHFVKSGESLFAIAKAYEITVSDIFQTNPESLEGIKTGQILKIPVKIKKEIASQPDETKYFYHIVKKQETLYGISKKYGVTIEKIKEINPTLNDYPRQGETIKIPATRGESQSAVHDFQKDGIKHIVSQGETLYAIARNYNITVGELKNANPGISDNLSIGQDLFIPNQKTENPDEGKGEKETTDTIFHLVTRGETIYHIAKKYRVPVKELKDFNPGIIDVPQPGILVSIPPSKPGSDFIIHEAGAKEKLSSIADLYQVDEENLLLLNPGLQKKITQGQQIKIPVDGETEARKILVNNDLSTANQEEIPCIDQEKNNAKTYNVALMIPLYLDGLDTIDFSRTGGYENLAQLPSFRFIGFYEGFLMAVDSLKKSGMNLNLFVYDVDNSKEKAQKALNSSEMSSMDLIIGPFYRENFEMVADMAKLYDINIVNPFSEREEILYNNPKVFKVKPAPEKKQDMLVSYVADEYPESNVIIIKSSKYHYQSEVSYVRNNLNSLRKNRVYITNKEILEIIEANDLEPKFYTESKSFDRDYLAGHLHDSTYFNNSVKELIYAGDSISGLRLNLSKARHNLVIAYSDDVVFSKEILSQLNKRSLNHDITLIGLPDWSKFEDLDIPHLLNLNFHCFNTSIVDFNSNHTISWIQQFRKIYKTEPGDKNFAFDGFDIGWYFLNAIFRYGNKFEKCLEYFNVQLLQTDYIFENKGQDGYQNMHWNIGQYINYELTRVNNKN